MREGDFDRDRSRSVAGAGSRLLQRWAIVLGVLGGTYAGGYAWARTSHCLVMWDGYRGRHGVHGADLGGPVPETAILMVLACEIIFWPATKLETALRPSRDP